MSDPPTAPRHPVSWTERRAWADAMQARLGVPLPLPDNTGSIELDLGTLEALAAALAAEREASKALAAELEAREERTADWRRCVAEGVEERHRLEAERDALRVRANAADRWARAHRAMDVDLDAGDQFATVIVEFQAARDHLLDACPSPEQPAAAEARYQHCDSPELEREAEAWERDQEAIWMEDARRATLRIGAAEAERDALREDARKLYAVRAVAKLAVGHWRNPDPSLPQSFGKAMESLDTVVTASLRHSPELLRWRDCPACDGFGGTMEDPASPSPEQPAAPEPAEFAASLTPEELAEPHECDWCGTKVPFGEMEAEEAGALVCRPCADTPPTVSEVMATMAVSPPKEIP